MTPRRHFIVGHADNPMMFYAPDAPTRWVPYEFEACAYPTEDAAIEAIVLDLNGKGRVVEIALPMVEAGHEMAVA